MVPEQWSPRAGGPLAVVIDVSRDELRLQLAGDEAICGAFPRHAGGQSDDDGAWAALGAALEEAARQTPGGLSGTALVTVSVFDTADGEAVRAIAARCLGGGGAGAASPRLPIIERIVPVPREALVHYCSTLTPSESNRRRRVRPCTTHVRATSLALCVRGGEASLLAHAEGYRVDSTARRFPLPRAACEGDPAALAATLVPAVVDVVRSAPLDLARDLLGGLLLCVEAAELRLDAPAMAALVDALSEGLSAALPAMWLRSPGVRRPRITLSERGGGVRLPLPPGVHNVGERCGGELAAANGGAIVASLSIFGGMPALSREEWAAAAPQAGAGGGSSGDGSSGGALCVPQIRWAQWLVGTGGAERAAAAEAAAFADEAAAWAAVDRLGYGPEGPDLWEAQPVQIAPAELCPAAAECLHADGIQVAALHRMFAAMLTESAEKAYIGASLGLMPGCRGRETLAALGGGNFRLSAEQARAHEVGERGSASSLERLAWFMQRSGAVPAAESSSAAGGGGGATRQEAAAPPAGAAAALAATTPEVSSGGAGSSSSSSSSSEDDDGGQ